jgi:ankyrin repeat protein
VFCQLVYLRRCIPGRIRRALDELPETLDGTYARTLEEIDDQNWEYAHRLFQCVAAASRPFFVSELAEFLAFDFKVGPTPTFLADWRPEDPAHAVLSMCSSLLAVVKPDGGLPVVQFAHFSVKEYLTSMRLAEAKGTISRFHLSMTPAHTVVAQACLGALLHLDKSVTKDGLKNFPLAEYAAEYWVGHAQFENVSSNVQDGMKRLFDPSKSHLSIWVWICDPEDPRRRHWRSRRPIEARAAPLHYAAFCGMYDIAAFLIVEHSQDINAQGFDKETPLHVASRQGHSDVAQLLLDHGGDSEAEDGDKCAPLVLASQGGHVEVARVLLEHGANTETRDDRKRITTFLASEDGYVVTASDLGGDMNRLNRTPLLLASQLGHVELARVLLKYSADKEARDSGDRTPLLLAAQVGHVEVARVLLEHGANTEAQDEFERTPLLLSLSFGCVEVARVLLEHGADANALGIDARHIASQYVDAKIKDVKWVTPLHLALEQELVEVVRVLLEHGVDANARDAKNAAMLLLASKHGHVKVTQALLEHGVDANIRDANNATSLHLASEYGRVEASRVLLERGSDGNARDADNATPLHWASLCGHVEGARVLLEYGVDVNARDAQNATPLHLASRYGHVEGVRVLLGHGADANAEDIKRATPLHLAIYFLKDDSGYPEVIRLLLQYGSDIHAQDYKDRTPFMIATERGNRHIMELLSVRSADDHHDKVGKKSDLLRGA